jgi:NAD(P)-dependent dehydrogenase (short-subunit alcohol dehydrogenase family)
MEATTPKESRVALITGGSRGIGAATAVALAAKGVRIFLASEGTEAELLAGVAACREAGAPDADFAIADLEQPGAAEGVVAACNERLARIDILVNNAGIRIRHPFGEYTRAEFDRLIAVNLAAPFFASQAVVPIMLAQGGGRIIHVASQLGTVTGPRVALYGLAKAALIHLTRSMAYELSASNILVNSVSPGPIATQFNLDGWTADPEMRDLLLGEVPLRRPGKPEEIAEAIAFLATSQGQYIQGHDLVVDGGFMIH